MTRAQAEAFLSWFKQAKTAASVPISDDTPSAEPAEPSPAEQVQSAIREVVDIFEPVVEIIEILFNAGPGEGLAVRADKKTGVIEKVEKVSAPAAPIRLIH